MKKVLIINTGVFEINGISEMISNLSQRLVIEKEYEITIGFNDDLMNEKYEIIFKNLGIETINLGNKRKNIFSYLKNLYLVSKKMDIIHVNGNSGMMGLEMFFLKKKKKLVLSHIHNTVSQYPKLEKIFKLIISNKNIVKLAASKMAGINLYGNTNFTVIPNGIDTGKFAFKTVNIDQVKAFYNIPLRKKIFLNVGRLDYQKNQERLVDIFKEMFIKNQDIHLLIVGDGNEYSNIKNKIKRYGLENHITILREVKEMQNIYAISNVFILPSRFEAFPVTLIEAQASGLVCLVSQESVGEEVNIDGNVKFISLSENNKTWANMTLNLHENLDRSENYKLILEKGYDRKNSYDKIIEIFKKQP